MRMRFLYWPPREVYMAGKRFKHVRNNYRVTLKFGSIMMKGKTRENFKTISVQVNPSFIYHSSVKYGWMSGGIKLPHVLVMQLAKAGFWRNNFFANSSVKYHDPASDKKRAVFYFVCKSYRKKRLKFSKNCEVFLLWAAPPFFEGRGGGEGAAVHWLNFNEFGETN